MTAQERAEQATAKRGVELRMQTADSANPLTPGRGFMNHWDATLNVYVNCEFGCDYCYARNLRPEDEPREEWGAWVRAKSRAGDQIERMLYGRQGNVGALDGKTISMGTSTDAYQPVEKQLRLTRHVLEAMAGAPRNHPQPMFEAPKPHLCIQTRSPLVCRDTDLLQQIERNGGRVQVNMTVTTDSREVRRRVEPKCMDTEGRLAAIRHMARAGVDTCVTVSPFLAADDRRAFARQLVNSGATRFVAQDLHPTDRPAYSAASSPGSDALVRQIHRERGTEYAVEYWRFVEALKEAIDMAGLTWMGEGKRGFRPPWS